MAGHRNKKKIKGKLKSEGESAGESEGESAGESVPPLLLLRIPSSRPNGRGRAPRTVTGPDARARLSLTPRREKGRRGSLHSHSPTPWVSPTPACLRQKMRSGWCLAMTRRYPPGAAAEPSPLHRPQVLAGVRAVTAKASPPSGKKPEDAE